MTAEPLSHKRCYNHAEREAAARCPSCGRHFCRECVTEHEGRVMCASCLAARTASRESGRSSMFYVTRVLRLTLALVAAYFFFYSVGSGLLSLPSSFHRGTLWEDHK